MEMGEKGVGRVFHGKSCPAWAGSDTASSDKKAAYLK